MITCVIKEIADELFQMKREFHIKRNMEEELYIGE